MRERLNLRMTAILLTTIILAGGGVALIHNGQVHRQVPGLLDLAQRAESNGQLERAIGLLNTYLGFVPGDTSARARAGILTEKLARDAKTWRIVIDIYEMVLEEDPGQVEVRTRLARIYVQASRSLLASDRDRDEFRSKAMNHLNALSAETASNAELAHMLAMCQEAQGIALEKRKESVEARKQITLAVKNYRRAIDLEPKGLGSYDKLAYLLRRGTEPGTWEEADRLIDQMVEANSREASAHLARARYLLIYPDFDLPRPVAAVVSVAAGIGSRDPEHDIRTAVELAPTNAEVRLLAANVSRDPEKVREPPSRSS